MRKRRSAKLPSKYVGNMPLDHASRRAGTHFLHRCVGEYREAEEKSVTREEGKTERGERKKKKETGIIKGKKRAINLRE